MRTCYSGPASECQCVDRSELIGALGDAHDKLDLIGLFIARYKDTDSAKELIVRIRGALDKPAWDYGDSKRT